MNCIEINDCTSMHLLCVNHSISDATLVISQEGIKAKLIYPRCSTELSNVDVFSYHTSSPVSERAGDCVIDMSMRAVHYTSLNSN